MFDKNVLTELLTKYKERFNDRWASEQYKWIAIKQFQDRWEIEAKEFAKMFEAATSKTENLLAAKNFYPKKMILEFANADQEATRKMFRNLYDENQDLGTRIKNFQDSAKALQNQYRKEKWDNTYQKANAISVLLWLKYPDKYFIFKSRSFKALCSILGIHTNTKVSDSVESLLEAYSCFEEVRRSLIEDRQLVSLLETKLNSDCYPDRTLHTLTQDFCYFVSQLNQSKQPSSEKLYSKDSENKHQYWWINANPKFWSFDQISIGEEVSFTLRNENGNKRRIYQNFLDAKAGDIVIGYESQPHKQIVAIGEISKANDGEKISFKKLETLANPIDYLNFKDCPELTQMEFLVNPMGTFFKLSEDEYNFILDLIRETNPKLTPQKKQPYQKADFLNDVFISEEQLDTLEALLQRKKNLILEGAPGVGKTFIAKRLAYYMMGERDENRIGFIQFHQNYSYEDFIMGYKPSENGFELRKGIFYNFCKKASDYPELDFFFIIDEINRGNLSKIFGELLVLLESDYRGSKGKALLTYDQQAFSIPENLYLIGMMNTADRSLAMIDYALRRRFSFYDIRPGFDSDGFKTYQKALNNENFNRVIDEIKRLNDEIAGDDSLGEGYCIGHSYFCGQTECSNAWLEQIIKYEIVPMLQEYWFDDKKKWETWEEKLNGAIQ